MAETDIVGGNTDSAPVASSPASFAEADWSDAATDSPSVDPSAQTTAPAGAETPPAAPEAQPQQDDRSPLIPRQRFDEVNTRMQTAEQKLQSLAWAEQIDQQTLQSALQWYGRYNGNPIEFLQSLAGEIQAHPEYGPQFKSFAARALSQRTATEPTMPEPDVAITDAQGQIVGRTYSAEALAKRDEYMATQLMAKLEQRFQPMTKTVETIQHERLKAQADSEAASTYQELQKLPGFEEHKGEIAAALAKLQLPDDPAVLKYAVKALYADIVTPKREQMIGSKAQSQLLDNLQHKAAASTGVNPGSAASSAPGTITSFHDSRLQW